MVEVNRGELEAGNQDSLPVEDTPEQQQDTVRGWLREVVETLLLAVIIWLAVNTATARFVVEGPSMEPSFHTGEFVLVSRMAYWQVFGEPQRGDVIVLHPPNKPTEEFIKRIVGLPGDTVEIRDGQVFVNNTLLEEPYIGTTTNSSGVWMVDDGEYFVMGDNRRNSEDSRTWADNQLPRDMIVGKAWLIYWPPKDWQLVPHQTYAAASPALTEERLAVAPTPTVVPPLVEIIQTTPETVIEAVPVPPTVTIGIVQDTPASDTLVGSLVAVTGTGQDGLAIREGAGVSYGARFIANDGASFRVEAGPRESDGYTWWYVVDTSVPERYGWAAQNFLSKLP